MAPPDLDALLAGAFRQRRWRVRRAASEHPGLIVEGNGKKYLVELKRASEGRSDRLIPLLSQGILETRAHARVLPDAVPVAVVGAGRIPAPVAEKLKRFALQVAPDMAVGAIDSAGLRVFAGHGLEALNANASGSARPRKSRSIRLPHLFSDLNQWMLKILLAGSIPENLLSAPREEFRHASQLARAANVSVMSASRFVRQLENDGFLDQRKGHFEIVRTPELLERWSAAGQRSGQDIPLRWIIKKDPRQLNAALKAAVRPPRMCLGLFAAADALGVGFVHGLPPYIYLDRIDADALRRLGLSAEDAEHNPDAFLRIPESPEAVFRPAVLRDGVPVSDILQTWLDVSTHPSRGREQADEIRRRVLKPLFMRK